MPYSKARLKAALELSSNSFVELARCLAAGYSEDPTFLSDFVQASGMGSRKAYYLLELGMRLPGLGVSEDRLQRIGWTKLRIIGGKLTRENARELLAKAEANTAVGLNHLVRGHQQANRSHCVQLYFTPKQYRQLEQAILQHGGQPSGRGLLNKEKAILRMIKRLSTPGPSEHRPMHHSSIRTLPTKRNSVRHK